MPALTYPKAFATRLTPEDGEKLVALARQLRTTPCAVLRILVRTAQPTDLPPVRFVAEGKGETHGEHPA